MVVPKNGGYHNLAIWMWKNPIKQVQPVDGAPNFQTKPYDWTHRWGPTDQSLHKSSN